MSHVSVCACEHVCVCVCMHVSYLKVHCELLVGVTCECACIVCVCACMCPILKCIVSY